MRDIPSTLRRISKIAQQTLAVHGIVIRHTQLLDAFASAAGLDGWHNARKLGERPFNIEDRRQFVARAVRVLAVKSDGLSALSADRTSDLTEELCKMLDKVFKLTEGNIFATGTAEEIHTEVAERIRRQRLPYEVPQMAQGMAVNFVGALADILVDRRTRGFPLDRQVFLSYLSPLKGASLLADTGSTARYHGYFAHILKVVGYTPLLESAVTMELAGQLPTRWNERYRLLGDDVGHALRHYETGFMRYAARAAAGLRRPKDEVAFQRSPNAINGNLCARCEPEAGNIESLVFDTGVCGLCEEVAEVVDLELLDVYEREGLNAEAVAWTLPRLRDPGLPGTAQGRELSLEACRERARDAVIDGDRNHR